MKLQPLQMDNRAAQRGSLQPLILAIARMFDGVTAEQIEALPGGTDARSFKLQIDGRYLVAKLPESRGGAILAPRAQFELSARLAAAGLAPKPIAYDEATQIQFVEMLQGHHPITMDMLRNGRIMDPIVALLQRLHSVQASLRPYDPITFASNYVGNQRAKDVAAVNSRFEELALIAEQDAAAWAGTSICHNDLHGANILLGTSLQLIDFEYAVQAAPIVDLASLAAMNDLTSTQAQSLVRRYYGDQAAPFSAREFRNAVRVQQLLAELWKIARSENIDLQQSETAAKEHSWRVRSQ